MRWFRYSYVPQLLIPAAILACWWGLFPKSTVAPYVVLVALIVWLIIGLRNSSVF